MVFYPIESALYSMAFGTHTKTAEPLEMSFGLMTLGRLRYHVLDVGPDPPTPHFGGLTGHSKILAIFAARRCKRDYSIANNVMQQSRASANSILKISGRRRCSISAANGMVGLHRVGRV